MKKRRRRRKSPRWRFAVTDQLCNALGHGLRRVDGRGLESFRDTTEANGYTHGFRA
jgi:hypothetical protein